MMDGYWTGILAAMAVVVLALLMGVLVLGTTGALVWLIRHGRRQRPQGVQGPVPSALASAVPNPWQALYPYWSAAQATLQASPDMAAAPIPMTASHQGAMREVTVLCCDIRGYTALVDQYPPHWIIQQLNEFLSGMTRVIFQHQGRLDKYLGDGLLAYFEPVDDSLAASAGNAACAALGMLDELNRLNAQWALRGLPTLTIGVGLHCGPVYIGTVGSHMRMDVTILGDAVNLASRLEAFTKQFAVRIVISEAVRRLLGRQTQARSLGRVPIRGKQQPEMIFELQTMARPAQAESLAPAMVRKP